MIARITKTGLQSILNNFKNAANSILLISNNNLQIDKTTVYSDIENYILYISDITNSTFYNDRYVKFDGLIDSTINQIITHVALAFIQQNTKKLISIMKINPTYVLNAPQNISYILDINIVQPIIDARSHFQDRCIIDYKILNYNKDFKYIVDGTTLTKNQFNVKYDGITSPYQINVKVDNVNFDTTTNYVESGIYPPSTYISADNTNRITISIGNYSFYGPIYFITSDYDKNAVHTLISDDITETYETTYESYFSMFYDVVAFVKPNRNYKIISRIYFSNTQSLDTTLDYSSANFPDYNYIIPKYTYTVENLHTVVADDNFIIIGEVGSYYQGIDGVFIYKKQGNEYVLNQEKIVSGQHDSRTGCSLSLLDGLLAIGEMGRSFPNKSRAGSVGIYENQDGTFTKITSIDGNNAYDEFGRIVKLFYYSGNVMLAAALYTSVNIYIKSGNNFNLYQTLNLSSPVYNFFTTNNGQFLILRVGSTVKVYKNINNSYQLTIDIPLTGVSLNSNIAFDPINNKVYYGCMNENSVNRIRPIKLFLYTNGYEYESDILIGNSIGMYWADDGYFVGVSNSKNKVYVVETFNNSTLYELPSFGQINYLDYYQFDIDIIQGTVNKLRILIPYRMPRGFVIEYLPEIYF